jgi:hypothetical protein
VFLGYSLLHKGYKCLHISTNRTYISHDVVFDETIFPFTQTSSDSTLPSSSILPLNPDQFVYAAYTPLLLAITMVQDVELALNYWMINLVIPLLIMRQMQITFLSQT